MPTIPKEVVLEELAANKKRHQVRFSMRKKGTGMLSVAVVRPFHHTWVVPTNDCKFMHQRSSEIEHRVCYDYYTLSWRLEPKPLVLFCQYSKSDGTVPLYPEAYKFWYLPPPKEANPKRLLSRASKHPALTVAEARTECPANEQEARLLYSQWQVEVAKLRAETPQISAREHLPKPQWLEEINRKNAEQYQLVQKHKKATKTFPFEGVYMFETRLEGGTTYGQCTMHHVAITDGVGYFLHCRYAGGEMAQEVRSPYNGWFQVPWELDGRKGRFHYFADIADPNLLIGGEDPNALVGENASITGRLKRIGNLTPCRHSPSKGSIATNEAQTASPTAAAAKSPLTSATDRRRSTFTATARTARHLATPPATGIGPSTSAGTSRAPP
jgi:hypothetical protein